MNPGDPSRSSSAAVTAATGRSVEGRHRRDHSDDAVPTLPERGRRAAAPRGSRRPRSRRTSRRRGAPLLPIGVPSRRPRTVSMIGVKGWFWANQLTPSGIVFVGTKALLRKGRRTRKIGRLLAVSTSRGHMPRATENQEMARAERARTPDRRDPLGRTRRRPEADHQGHDHHDGERQEGLDHAADDVAGEDRRPTDGHRPESVDDALGHVHRDRERCALGGAGHGDQQDARQDVGGVFGSSAGHAAQARPERSAENEHEQQQEDRRGCRR